MKQTPRRILCSLVILLCFSAMLACGGGWQGAMPTISSLIPSAPTIATVSANAYSIGYNGAAQLGPVFQGGTGVLGTTGAGSHDISSAAVSGSSYTTAKHTSVKNYTLTVTSPGNQVVTSTITITPTPVVISAVTPAAKTIAAGGTQTFAATITGGATNTGNWTGTGGSFSGATWTAPATAGTYTITFTSVDDPTKSASTTVTSSLPVITTQPVSAAVKVGGSVILTAAANYAVSYQWYKGGAAISGATGTTYTIPAAAAADAGDYTFVATNPAGSVTSNVATVIVGTTIVTNPKSLSIYATQTATFSVAAKGLTPFTYQWYVIPSGSSTGTAISGATSNVYTTPATDTSYSGNQYYAIVTDSASETATSTNATLTVTAGNVPPTIITNPASQVVSPGTATAAFTVVASGTPTLAYQWYRIPAGTSPAIGTLITGATSATYTLPATATTTANDQDGYFCVVTNGYGQATSTTARLAVGNGIVITMQPVSAYVNTGLPATFSVTATSNLPLSYQWYKAAPGSSTFTAISGATNSTYTYTPALTDTGSVFKVVVSNGSTASVTSTSVGLFVGALSGISGFCSTSWSTLGNAVATGSSPNCAFQITAASTNQHSAIIWPMLISPANLQLSFTITVSNPSTPPADGFALVLSDPSLGATTTTSGSYGYGLGAAGIPGFVLAFDDWYNDASSGIASGDPYFPGDPDEGAKDMTNTYSYLGVGRGEMALFENPWFNTNTNIPPLANAATVAHNYVVTIVQGQMTVTMDGVQVFSGGVIVPPVAYFMVTGSTGGEYQQTVISNLSATVSAP
jgi:hypothetical protein